MNIYKNINNGKLYLIEHIITPLTMLDWEKKNKDKTSYCLIPYNRPLEEVQWVNNINNFMRYFQL